ncbi:hypothetical protein [Mycobacterium colombiense]|nr:hypothetical protein [Mycobacterium colombiense]
MTLESHLQTWWAQRSEEQRTTLKDAANQKRMDAATVQLVLGT